MRCLNEFLFWECTWQSQYGTGGEVNKALFKQIHLTLAHSGSLHLDRAERLPFGCLILASKQWWWLRSMHRNHTDAPLKHRYALHCSKTLQKSKVAKEEVILWWCSNGGSMLRLRVKYPPVWDAATLKRLWEEQHTTMASLFLTPPLPPILCICFFWRVQIFHSTSLLPELHNPTIQITTNQSGDAINAKAMWSDWFRSQGCRKIGLMTSWYEEAPTAL